MPDVHDDPEDETLMAAQCRHGVFDEINSYEACVGGTYSFMNKGKPMKQCSSCGEAKKPTNSKPIYYCRKCHLHRVYLDCWTKENLREQETKSKTNTHIRSSRRKARVSNDDD